MLYKILFFGFLLINCCYNLVAIEEVLIKPELVEFSGLPEFYVAQIPVTQDFFREVMGVNPAFFIGDSLPVESVSWYEAIVFCNKLSVLHNLEPVYSYEGDKDVNLWGRIPNHRVTTWTRINADSEANGYRLLSHLEWNYLYSFLKDELNEDIEEYAWIYTNSENKIHPVATKKQDSLGLFDFLGNVFEWRFEHSGNLTENYFIYNSPEQEEFFSRLGYKKFENRDFLTLRNHQGLYPVIKNSLVGFRIGRNKE